MRSLPSRAISVIGLLFLLSFAFVPASRPVAAASPVTLNIGAVLTEPIQSLTQLDQPFPGFFTYDNAGVMALWSIYPYFLFGNGTYVADGLVTSTDTIASNNTYIVHLRNNTGWSNGQPVTAWDMYASLMAIYGLGSPPYPTKVINNYTLSIQVPNDAALGLSGLNLGSFIFGPDDGDVPILWNYNQWKPVVNDIAGNFTGILAGNTTVLAALTKEEEAHTAPMMFNGPYYPVSVTSSEILLQKNPYYFDAAKITIPHVVIHQYTTPSALYQALTSGQIDFYFGGTTINDGSGAVVPTQYQAVMPSYMEQFASQGYTGPSLFFNNATTPLLVREAIAYTINRTEVAQAGGVSYSAITYPDGLSLGMYGNYSGAICNSSCEAAMNPYAQNTTKATALMQQAGFTLTNGAWQYSNGTKLTLTLLNAQSTDSTWLSMALDIESQLSAFGININLLNPSNPTSIAITGKGFDMYMQGFGWFPTTWDIYRTVQLYDGVPYPIMHDDSNVTVGINNAGKTTMIALFHNADNAKNQTALGADDEDLAWLVNHYVTYLQIAETNPIAYANTHDFNWPPANSPIWGVIIGVDPGAAIITAEQAGQLTPTSGASGTVSSSGSTTSSSVAVSSSGASTNTSITTTTNGTASVPTTATATTSAITTTTSTAPAVSSSTAAVTTASSSSTTTTSSSTAITNVDYLVAAAIVIGASLALRLLNPEVRRRPEKSGNSPHPST